MVRNGADDYTVFREILKFTLGKEGGLNDDTDDRGNKGGGITWKGLTDAVFRRAKKTDLTDKTRPQDLTDLEIENIYYRFFWQGAHCDSLPYPLCFAVFDISVNSGTGGAVNALQETLNDMFRKEYEISADGAWGPQTEKAVETLEKLDGIVRASEAGKILDTLPTLACCICLYERTETYVEIREKHPEDQKYFYGWVRARVKDLGKRLGF